MSHGRNYYPINSVTGHLGSLICLFTFITIKKNDKLDELQDAREKEYQRLLLQLTDKFAVVSTMNDKLDKLYSKHSDI